MLEWVDQILYRTDALAIPLGILYILLNRRARHRLRNARLASALLVELRLVRGAFRKIGEEKDHSSEPAFSYKVKNGQQRDIMRRVYDGLLASSNIAYFSPNLQKRLHDAYTAFNSLTSPPYVAESANDPYPKFSKERLQLDDGLQTIDEAITEVESFYNCNRRSGKWFRLLKALRLEYDD